MTDLYPSVLAGPFHEARVSAVRRGGLGGMRLAYSEECERAFDVLVVGEVFNGRL